MASHVEPKTPRSAVAITPSDTTTFDGGNGGKLHALYIGVAGNVAVLTVFGETTTFVGAVAGSTIPIECTKVMSTNTTATSIVGLRY